MDRVELLLHPVRLRIVGLVASNPLTPLEIVEALGDVAQATVYRHVTQLTDGGVLKVVEERPARRGTERVLGVVEEAVSLGAEDVADADRDDHLRWFTTFALGLVSGYARYLGDTDQPDLAADGVGYRSAALWLTDVELDELVERLSSAVAEVVDNRPGPGRRRRTLATVLFPDPPVRPGGDRDPPVAA